MSKSYTHVLNLSKIKTHGIDVQEMTAEITFTEKELADIYADMFMIRKIEDASQVLFNEEKIRGFCHLATGQESIYAAYKHFADQKDTCTTSYRCHGLSYATGDEPKTILAELMGRKDGMCGGKGGSMHLYNSQFFGGHGIVGASVPLAVGTAFRHKYVNLKKGNTLDKMAAENVAFSFYGDGAANQGQIFEVYNMAGRWKLPVVFVCENNQYGMWTGVDRVSYETDFYKRGGKLPGICIDHSNVFDLIGAFRFARKYVLESQPIIIEIKTYRICTHSARDGPDFRPEIEEKKSDDVLIEYRKFISEFFSEQAIQVIEKDVASRFEQDLAFAHQSLHPDPSNLYTNVLQKD
ncbi:Pyruvate dehydrogenase E1, alpha subunit [Pseudoloma neurophilia]|uniref:Pyruvate dehydrogenase E1, alpha subunit n=1 Tax=Pseudoloma neurophilia TaxID=146866 RepID=A0A0R0M555_9MICR|nr:Pyruvate dehydrogenase E1, alpha subunit [Pseudoloma neurophilia]